MYRLYCKLCDCIIEVLHKLIFKDRFLKLLRMDWFTMVQFLRFVFVGFTNVAVSLIIYYIFLFINPTLYLIGNTVGYFAGVMNSYCLNSIWVFKKNGFAIIEFLKTCGCYLITYFLQTFLLYTMVDVWGWSDIIAPIINIIIATPINFILNKIWAFKE